MKRAVGLALIGAVAFWLPDTIWHAVRGYEFTGFDVLGVTAVMPLTLLCTYVFFHHKNKKFRGWPLMLGVWELGGIFMLLGASFSGGGFTNAHSFSELASTVLLSFVPLWALVMATYDGSLGALVIVSLVGFGMFLIGLSRGRYRSAPT